jgi:PIN domain
VKLPPLLILDTCILEQDFARRGNDWKVLRRALETGQLRLAVPEVVLVEIRNRFEKTLAKKARAAIDSCQKAQVGIDALDRHLGRLPSTLKLPPFPVEEDFADWVKLYDDELRRDLAALGATILPFPRQKHEYLVTRAMTKQRPFSESAKGYQDTLIWLSIIDYIVDRSDELLFVSENSADFADPDDKESFHPDLVRDLSVSEAEVRYCVSLQAAFAGPVSSTERTREDVEEIFRGAGGAALLDALLPKADPMAGPFVVGFGPDQKVIRRPRIRSVVDIENAEVRFARPAEGGTYIVDASIEMEAQIAGLVELSDLVGPVFDSSWRVDVVSEEGHLVDVVSPALKVGVSFTVQYEAMVEQMFVEPSITGLVWMRFWDSEPF